MTQKFLQTLPHESENQTEQSIVESYTQFHNRLKPPFSLSIPSKSEYLHLNRAILHSILTEPDSHNRTHFTHLAAIVTDGYEFFVSLLLSIVNESYPKLLPHARTQLLWIFSKMIDVSAIGVEDVLISLLRWITGGDFSDGNLWLSMELLGVLSRKWDWLVEEPLRITSVLFTYLRLLTDHYRLLGSNFDSLKKMEVEFCVRVLRERFGFCLRIGRDLVRLLQDLVHIPEIKAIWKDLLLNPGEFKVQGFTDILQLYLTRTSSRYFLLRVTPEMETQLRFLLTYVKWGRQKRYQVWFAKKFLCLPERETIIGDLVRFICCGHHPSNEIIQSDIISRWAVIGWLLKSCSKNYVEANVKLALFYDWLFFDRKVDNIMNIEPAILLMVHSIPKYIGMTNGLLEFLFLLVDNYDIHRKDIIVRGVSASFDILVEKGVIHSLDILTSCGVLSPFLKARLSTFVLNSKQAVAREVLAPSSHSNVPLNLSKASDVEGGEPVSWSGEKGFDAKALDAAISSENSSPTDPVRSDKSQMGVIENLIKDLPPTLRQSKKRGLDTLETILFYIASLDKQEFDTVADGTNAFNPESLACQISDAFKSYDCEMFTPLGRSNELNYDEEIQSATALVIRYFLFGHRRSMEAMFLFWSKNDQPVGPRILSYISRLAYEAHSMDRVTNPIYDKKCFSYSSSNGVAMAVSNGKVTANDFDFEKSLLKYHIEGYISFLSSSNRNNAQDAIFSASSVDIELVDKLVGGAFAAYRYFLQLSGMKLQLSSADRVNSDCQLEDYSKNISSRVKQLDQDLAISVVSDLKTCCNWNMKRSKWLFHSISCHLSDLTTANKHFILMLVNQLNHVDLVHFQFGVGLKRFSIFGGNIEIICQLVKSSLEWDFAAQQKYWALLISELAASKLRVEKLLIDLCSGLLDLNEHHVAVDGLFTLLRCHSPSLELVGAVMSLPDAFGDFAGAILATWVVSNSSMLFDNLVEWLDKLNNVNVGSISLKSLATRVNYSAIRGFLKFLDTEDKSTDCLSSMAVNIPHVKARLADIMM